MNLLEQHDILVIAALTIVAITATTLIDGGITGRVVDISQRDSMISFLKTMATLENQHVDEMPEIFRAIFGNQHINGTILMNSYELIYVGAMIEEGKVISITPGDRFGTIPNPTMNVFTTETVIRDIANSKDPALQALKALRDQKIKYTALSTSAQLQMVAADIASQVI
ncbi:hypothetical protein HY641_00770 [Candidatus Woesearchaeota archaeon]|nr:hypothetical protein [Candidatus Woesearchaeota archaeon]